MSFTFTLYALINDWLLKNAHTRRDLFGSQQYGQFHTLRFFIHLLSLLLSCAYLNFSLITFTNVSYVGPTYAVGMRQASTDRPSVNGMAYIAGVRSAHTDSLSLPLVR